jgi:hypothetical protein
LRAKWNKQLAKKMNLTETDNMTDVFERLCQVCTSIEDARADTPFPQKTTKVGVRGKRLQSGWDNKYLGKLFKI